MRRTNARRLVRSDAAVGDREVRLAVALDHHVLRRHAEILREGRAPPTPRGDPTARGCRPRCRPRRCGPPRGTPRRGSRSPARPGSRRCRGAPRPRWAGSRPSPCRTAPPRGPPGAPTRAPPGSDGPAAASRPDPPCDTRGADRRGAQVVDLHVALEGLRLRQRRAPKLLNHRQVHRRDRPRVVEQDHLASVLQRPGAAEHLAVGGADGRHPGVVGALHHRQGRAVVEAARPHRDARPAQQARRRP